MTPLAPRRPGCLAALRSALRDNSLQTSISSVNSAWYCHPCIRPLQINVTMQSSAVKCIVTPKYGDLQGCIDLNEDRCSPDNHTRSFQDRPRRPEGMSAVQSDHAILSPFSSAFSVTGCELSKLPPRASLLSCCRSNRAYACGSKIARSIATGSPR